MIQKIKRDSVRLVEVAPVAKYVNIYEVILIFSMLATNRNFQIYQ